MLPEFGELANVKELPRIEVVVAEELPNRSMDTVGSRLGHQVDHSSRVISSCKEALLHLELLDGVDRLKGSGSAVEVLLEWYSVENESRGARPAAGNRYSDPAATVDATGGRAAVRVRHNPGLDSGQLNEVPPVERKLSHHLLTYNRSQVGGDGVDGIDVCLDRDLLGHLSYFKNYSLVDDAADIQLDVADNHLFEPLHVNRQVVPARRQCRETKQPLFIGDTVSCQAGFEIVRAHLRSGNDGLSAVDHAAANCSGRLLCPHLHADHKKSDRQERREPSCTHGAPHARVCIQDTSKMLTMKRHNLPRSAKSNS